MKNIILISAAIFLCTFTGAHGQIIHVPANRSTIQAGIDAAEDGDTVMVDTGTYEENINFRKKAITVASHFIQTGDTNDIINTIIDGRDPDHPDSASVVMFTSGEDTTSVLCGFTLTKGSGLLVTDHNMRLGGGVSCFNSGARIINNVIIDNEVVHNNMANGGGIGAYALTSDTWIIMKDNTITGNTSDALDHFSNGGGIFIAANGRIETSTIENNLCQCDFAKADGGGIMIDNASGGNDTVYVENNLIRNNIVSADVRARGGGIFSIFMHTYVYNNEIINNSVTGNLATGGGMTFTHNLSTEVINNIVRLNRAITDNVWWGAGILCSFPDGPSIITNNLIEDNNGPMYNSYPNLINVGNGGGVCVLDPFMEQVIVDGNFFINDTAKIGGGCYFRDAWNIEFCNNVFTRNFAFMGGALRTYEILQNTMMPRQIEDSLCPLVANNSFLENHASYQGGAVYSTYDNYPPVFFNNIFWESYAADSGHDLFLEGIDDVLIENCITTDTNILGNWSGHGNKYEDPLFVPGDDSLHISNGSPCIATGIVSVIFNDNTYSCATTDYEGDPRPLPAYNEPDIGADEISEWYQNLHEPLTQLPELRMNIFPNPCLNTTIIRFTLQSQYSSGSNLITIDVYTLAGTKVHKLVTVVDGEGDHQVKADLSGLPSGLYFCVMKTADIVVTEKLVKL